MNLCYPKEIEMHYYLIRGDGLSSPSRYGSYDECTNVYSYTLDKPMIALDINYYIVTKLTKVLLTCVKINTRL